jgi:hypothetical protein
MPQYAKMPPKYTGPCMIDILGARKLTKKSLIGKMSPYVVIKLGKKIRLVSKVCQGADQECTFNNRFKLNIDENTPQLLNIEVWTKELFADAVIGKLSVYLGDVERKCGSKKGAWVGIHSKQYKNKVLFTALQYYPFVVLNINLWFVSSSRLFVASRATSSPLHRKEWVQTRQERHRRGRGQQSSVKTYSASARSKGSHDLAGKLSTTSILNHFDTFYS